MTETGVFIRGHPAPLGDAIREAASILARSRNPIIAGLGTDIDGGQAAIRLARRLSAAFDHIHAGAALRDLGVMRRAGWIVTTPLQTRARADLVLLVGPGLDEVWQDYRARLGLDAAPTLVPNVRRHVIHLCPDGDPTDVTTRLGLLRALLAGRPLRDDARIEELRGHAEALTAARFGVAIWSAARIDDLAIEMLCGLIDQLNKNTRFAGLPLDPGDNATGVMQAAAWQTGFPARTGWVRGVAEHDPWRFDAVRMVESGEADAAVWISALAPQSPPWRGAVKLVSLTVSGTPFATPPDVGITVGHAGVDHDSVLFDRSSGTLAFHPAASPSGTPRASALLESITTLIGDPAC